jgi:hypothetical protein
MKRKELYLFIIFILLSIAISVLKTELNFDFIYLLSKYNDYILGLLILFFLYRWFVTNNSKNAEIIDGKVINFEIVKDFKKELKDLETHEYYNFIIEVEVIVDSKIEIIKIKALKFKKPILGENVKVELNRDDFNKSTLLA